MLQQFVLPIATKGMATAFEDTETPLLYCLKMTNRFINASGGAEKRQGMTLSHACPTTNAITGLHELVTKSGQATMYASDSKNIYKLDTLTTVYSFSTTAAIRSVQISDNLVFYNGYETPVVTLNGTTYEEFLAEKDIGKAGTGTGHDKLIIDTSVNQTAIAAGDVVYNVTTSSYGIVTALGATDTIVTTSMETGSASFCGRGGNQAANDRYRILDTVALNVIPTDDDNEYDNIAVADASTSVGGTCFAAVSIWSNTRVRQYDFIRNTTRGTAGRILSWSGKWILHTEMTGNAAGDTIVLYTNAVPVATVSHVHYGRLYMVDKSDQTKIRISSPNNPKDFYTEGGSLNSSSIFVGAYQPEGDTVTAIASYQRFLVIAGKKYIYLFEGTDPVSTSIAAADFKPVGLYPKGIINSSSLITIGNDAVLITNDGVQGVTLSQDSSTIDLSNLSESIKTTLRDAISNANTDEVVLFHYPKRSGVCAKIGSKMYVYNYAPFFGQGDTGQYSIETQRALGSWCEFDGLFAEQRCYLVKRDGALISGGPGGKVYNCDVSGVYTDNGIVYSTVYQTAWVQGHTKHKNRIKKGMYISPIINAASTNYMITEEAPYNTESHESINISTSTFTG